MNATIPQKPTIPDSAATGRPSSPQAPIRLEVGADGIAFVRFDRQGSSANILDRAALAALSDVLDQIESHTDLRGVIFVSEKPAVFIAGADLKELLSASDRAPLVDLGQSLFARIAALPIVTVAAIHGACAGGGLELALACDFRVASKDAVTRIGLPEVTLGLVPAWGGSTRLPRIVGPAKAMKAILRGDLMPAERAVRVGVVDGLAPRERLTALATKLIAKGKGKRARKVRLRWRIEAPIAEILARRASRRRTRGNYPAPDAAIGLVAQAIFRSPAKSLAAEKEAILELADTEVTRNLIRIFFLQNRSKRLAAPRARAVQKAAVIGAGTMGAGIAQWLASRGMDVVLRDVAPEALARGLQKIEKLFKGAAQSGVMSRTQARAGRDRITPVDVPVDMRTADLVIEAAVEKLVLKKQVFQELEDHVRSDSVLATNTSALPIGEIARGLRHPERVVGLHFFNPVHRMKLVEVVRTTEVSDEAIETAIAFVQRIGKLPVVVKDSPGFAVNRILLPYLLEAVRLHAEGVPVQDLDESMLDFGMPMGPMRLLDEIGLDVAADVARTLCDAFPDRLRMSPAFSQLLEGGMLGRKSAAGFYCYRKGRESGVNRRSPIRTGRGVGARIGRAELQERMVLAMLNESARCLEEGVVGQPADIDMAMVMGTGFAPFRGGPLRYADALGLDTVEQSLRRLSDTEPMFAPCALIPEMARSNRRFYDD
jgi:3-hydroxyacyl-CoA dehydrogenase/enoyl-CoA hydratase/3-hydroxybutyryl-CoA epimerase